MNDFSSFARTATPAAEVLSVSALARSVRDLLEHRFPLVWVAGEISNLTLARSGHWYFSLKDDNAQVRCVMFRHRAQYLDWQPREGMHVEARALVTLYEPRGDFQLNVEFMRQAGQGALYEAFLRLRDKLAAEGLFDPALKRELPSFPRTVGVVTSLQAAALRDVLTVLARRNPSISVIVYPTSVQGEGAPEEIVAALRTASRRNEVDALILCRGGGSIEDLWAFNNEAVARAIRACPMPVVCGVGHETDVTIADLAADRRAPTPTAAAEMLSPEREVLLAQLARLAHSLGRSMRRTLESRMQQVDYLAKRLIHPARQLQTQQLMLEQLRSRLLHATARHIERLEWQTRSLMERSCRALPNIGALHARVNELMRRVATASGNTLAARAARVEHLARALAHLDPRAVLARGYSIVTDEQGRIVCDAAALARGDALRIAFARGEAKARVEETRGE